MAGRRASERASELPTTQPRLRCRYSRRAFPGQHPLSSAGREPLPAGAGGCPRLRRLPPRRGSLPAGLGPAAAPHLVPHFTPHGLRSTGQARRGRARAPSPPARPRLGRGFLIPLRDPGSVARAKTGWVAGGAGGGDRPRAVDARVGGWVAGWMPPPSPRPAPSSTFLVGVARWVFYSKSRLAIAGRSFPMLFMCMCLSV